MRVRVLGILATLAAMATVAAAAPVEVKGRAVGPDGKPVAGIGVGYRWDQSGATPRSLFDEVKTDAEGRFTLPVEFYDHPAALMACDAEGKLGGFAIVEPAKAGEPVEVRVGPLCRAVGTLGSKDASVPLRMGGIYAYVGDNGPVAVQCFLPEEKPGQRRKNLKEFTEPLHFDLRLPPGKYVLQCYEPMLPSEHMGLARRVELKPEHADKPLDLGTIAFEVNPMVRMLGKPAPPLRIKAARGVPDSVKIEDFKGKWIILEFWATWCGPCVARGLPDAMDFYDEHEADRDKFVILAVHGDGSDDLADMDKKAAPIVRDLWFGRELPFPILLDDDKKTFAAYGIESIPQTIAIDPEGKIVKGGIDAVGKALLPVPIARRVALGLDRQVQFLMDADGLPLGTFLERLGQRAGIAIGPDPTVKLAIDRKIPMTITGRLSLRSWLDLALRPLGLAATPGPEGLVVGPAGQDGPPAGLSPPQARCADRIAKKLDGPITLDFRGATLAEVAAKLQDETGENFLLDVSDRIAGQLDPSAKVSGRVDGVSIREAIAKILGPLGIEASIRDELVVLSKRPSP